MIIVGTDAGDNSHHDIHKNNGFITKIHDHDTISENLRELIETPKIRNPMGQESYNHLVRDFSYKSFRNKYLKVLQLLDDIQINKKIFGIRDKQSSNQAS